MGKTNPSVAGCSLNNRASGFKPDKVLKLYNN
jgi:hypothetical protein